VADFAVTTPPGLSRWIDDWWPVTDAYIPMAAIGLVPVEPRLTARLTIGAPRGQAGL